MSNYATFSQHAKNAEYIVQDPDLWVCRRYDRLHIFNLLNLQQKLSKLEDKLDELLKQELMQKSRCLPEQMLQDQASLVEELQEAVRKYGRLLKRQLLFFF
jgi:hypothetical protein